MRLATYIRDDAQSFGVVVRDGVADVLSLWPDGPKSVMELLRQGPKALAEVQARAAAATRLIPLDRLKLLAPIPEPSKLIGLAGNYVKHIKEFDKGKGLSDRPRADTTPRPFLMPSTAVIGSGTEIPWPAYSRQIDYEIELAVIVGAKAKCVSPRQAIQCVAGYAIANDVSARSVTFAQGRAARPWDEFYDWLNGKWADGFCPLGPCLVTADEVSDVRNLNLELTVNGQLRQKANTSEMIYDVFEIVSFLSHIMTLLPGDVIATGTPAGVAMASGAWLKGGDVITCRIDGLGEMTNRLGVEPGEFYNPCASQ